MFFFFFCRNEVMDMAILAGGGASRRPRQGHIFCLAPAERRREDQTTSRGAAQPRATEGGESHYNIDDIFFILSGPSLAFHTLVESIDLTNIYALCRPLP